MQSSAIEDLRGLAFALLGRASTPGIESVGGSFDERVMTTISLIDHNEWGVGFENLTSNIFEFEVPLTRSEFSILERAGSAFELAPRKWRQLESLVQ